MALKTFSSLSAVTSARMLCALVETTLCSKMPTFSYARSNFWSTSAVNSPPPWVAAGAADTGAVGETGGGTAVWEPGLRSLICDPRPSCGAFGVDSVELTPTMTAAPLYLVAWSDFATSIWAGSTVRVCPVTVVNQALPSFIVHFALHSY